MLLPLQIRKNWGDWVHLGYMLLLCSLILVVFGVGETLLRTLNVRTPVAVLILTTMLLGYIVGDIYISNTIFANLAGVSALFVGLVLYFKTPGRLRFLSVLLALFAGFIVYLVFRYVNNSNQAVLYGGCCALLASFAAKKKTMSMFIACVSPIAASAFYSLADYIAEDFAVIYIGGGGWADTIVISFLLTSITTFAVESISSRKLRSRRGPYRLQSVKKR